jgi:protein-L-isoaspartate(D-aspartate) O-methyltransferase
MKTGWYPFAVARDQALSYLTVRDLPDGGVELGAHAYGDHAEEAAAAMIRHLHAWDARGRDLPEDSFAFCLDGASARPPGRLETAFRKCHGTVTITWPPERAASQTAN